MRIRVLLFAQLREAMGAERVLEVPDGCTAGEAARILLDGSGAAHAGPELLYAVNEEFEPASRPLKDGDVLAVLTPMSGG